MLVVVVVLFTVCWLPYHVMMMYDNFGGKMTGTVFQLIMFGFWLSLLLPLAMIIIGGGQLLANKKPEKNADESE